MDDERRELIRRLFTALTVQAEKCAEIGSQGQLPTLDARLAANLVTQAIELKQLMSMISDAVNALVE